MTRLVTVLSLFLFAAFSSAQEYTLYTHDNSELPYNAIYCIDFDLDGDIWFGGQKDAATGVATVSTLAADLSSWTVWGLDDLGLSDLEDRVFYMAVDDENTMWMCTHYGVSYKKSDGSSGYLDFTRDKYTRTVETDSKGNIYISQREDERDSARVWVSSDHGENWEGWFMADLGYTLTQQDARPEIYDLREDSQGQLWVLTWYGVSYRDTNGDWNLISEIEGDWTYAMTIDPNDNLWVPINGNLELVKIENIGTVTFYDSEWSDALQYDINDLEADVNGTLWLATNGGGLIALQDDGSFTQYDSASTGDQIPQDVLTHLEIKDNEIWVSTESEGIVHITGLITGLEDEVLRAPQTVRLEKNYPNPFNPSTTIEYSLDKARNITLAVYDISGKKVRTLVSGSAPAGDNQAVWNGLDDNGNGVSSGVYFYRLHGSGISLSGKMLLVK